MLFISKLGGEHSRVALYIYFSDYHKSVMAFLSIELIVYFTFNESIHLTKIVILYQFTFFVGLLFVQSVNCLQ